MRRIWKSTWGTLNFLKSLEKVKLDDKNSFSLRLLLGLSEVSLTHDSERVHVIIKCSSVDKLGYFRGT